MQSVRVVCDLCGSKADREIQVNGRNVAVCSPGCYTKYWVREYEDWRQGKYQLEVRFGNEELATEIERKLEVVTKRSSG